MLSSGFASGLLLRFSRLISSFMEWHPEESVSEQRGGALRHAAVRAEACGAAVQRQVVRVDGLRRGQGRR